MKLNTPTLWQQFRRRIGLPGTTRVVDIDSTTVCRMARTWAADAVITEQELAEFGYPTRRKHMEA